MELKMEHVHNQMELRCSHLRAFRGQISECRPTQAEGDALDKAGIANERARSYLVWRRSCLVVASPFVGTSVLLGLVELSRLFGDGSESDTGESEDQGYGNLNFLGKVMMFLTGVNSIFLQIGMSMSMKFWSQAQISMKLLRFGWLASFLLPLAPALFPIEMILTEEFKEQSAEELGQESYNTTLLLIKIMLALSYAIQLLPVVIAFPGGAVRGALRILGLLPQSTLPGWILVVAAPFYSLLVCVALIMVIQVAGNGLLFLATLLMVCAPLVYMVRGHLFTQDKNASASDERENELKKTQRTSAILNAVAIFLLLIWAFTAESNNARVLGHRKSDHDYLLTWGRGLRLVLEMTGRLLVTTILFSDILLAMAVCHWKEERSMIKKESRETDMKQLNIMLYGAVPVYAPPETLADQGELPPMAFRIADATERAEVDDSSRSDSSEDEMSV